MTVHAAKVVLCVMLLACCLLFAQTKIDIQQAKFGNPVIPIFVDGEVPSGAINGTNTVFTLAATPSPASSVHLYWNGLRQNPTAGGDYTIVGNTITTSVASTPQTGDLLIVDYRH
jgi:hypothetical protein